MNGEPEPQDPLLSLVHQLKKVREELSRDEAKRESLLSRIERLMYAEADPPAG